MNRAVFVDRDGTLIEEENYLADPAAVSLTRGTAAALRDLRAAGYRIVVVSNQAGVARGYFGASTVRAIQAHIDALLKAEGAWVDAYYFCPHHPDFTGPCRCRKPAPGMLVDAERDLELDLPSCWMIGDRLSDMEAGRRVGCRGILVRTGYGAGEERLLGAPESPTPVAVAENLGAAAKLILGQ